MSHLFSSLQIRNLFISNRIVMPPMALDIATETGEVTSKLIDHYLLRARVYPEQDPTMKWRGRAGLGLIIVEHAYVNTKGKVHPHQLGIHKNSMVDGLKKLVTMIHKEGVPVGIQISHAGARALHSPSAPSGIRSPYLSRFGQKQEETGDPPSELSREEIRRIVADFGRAARRAKQAGFDFVEIHGAHGYLLNQFYSPLTNLRGDEYGGTLEGRLRFPLEVISTVRKAVGVNMPLFYRLGADDRLFGGNHIHDSVEATPRLREAGIDCLDLSGGLCGYLKSGPEGFFAYMASAIKPVVDIPVMVTGGIKTRSAANEIITSNTADLVGIGRTLLTDPAWAGKVWHESHSRREFIFS